MHSYPFPFPGYFRFSSLVALLILRAPFSFAQAQDARVVDSLNSLYASAQRAGNAIVVDQGAWKALYSADGKPLTPFIYTEIQKGLSGNFVAGLEDKSFLLDSLGNTLSAFGGPVNVVDSFAQQYRFSQKDRSKMYDASGLEFLEIYTNDAENHAGNYIWQRGYTSIRGVKDTLGHIILPQEYDGQISLGREGIAAIKQDTVYGYSTQGKFRFKCRADDCLILPHGVTAVKLYGLWALRDSTGKVIAHFDNGRIDAHQDDRFINTGDRLIDYSGKEIAKGNLSYAMRNPGGWLEVHYNNSLTGAEIRDDQFNLVFPAGAYQRHEFIGRRFIRLFKDYNDRAAQIYDMQTRQFTDYLVESALTGDAYVIYISQTGERRILKGNGLLALPRFTEAAKQEYYPFIILTDEGKNSRKYLEEPGRDGRRDFTYLLTVVTSGKPEKHALLDTNMRVIVPMGATDIKILSRDLIHAYQPKDSSTYIYNGSGKILLKVRGAATVQLELPLVRITNTAGTILMDTAGTVRYRGKELPSLLYVRPPTVRYGSPAICPSLLLYDDSSGYSGLYTLGGRQLLPHRYYAVAQKVPGLFSLKSGDSVYFANTKGRLMFGERGFAGRTYYMLEGYAVLMQDAQQQWAIIGAEGQPLLPFTFDTLAFFKPPGQAEERMLGKDGRYALLDNTGKLRYPLQAWVPVRRIADDYYLGSDGRYYHIRNRQAVETMPAQYWAAPARSRQYFSTWWDHLRTIGTGDALPSGIYNRRMKRVGDYYPKFSYRTFRDKMVITDSAMQHVALLDSSGALAVPFIPNPAVLLVTDSSLAAFYPDGKDRLYHLEGGTYKRRDIIVDEPLRTELMKENSRGMQVNNGRVMAFTNTAGVKGIITYSGELLLDEGIRQIYQDGYAWRIQRAGNRWGLLNPTTLRYYYPPDADTIATLSSGHQFILFRNGRQGLYYGETGTFIPPLYERIYNPGSLGQGFVIAKAAEGFAVLDKRGRRVSPYLDSINVNSYTLLDAPAILNRAEVSLSVGDDGAIIVHEGLDAKVKRTGISGYYSNTVVVQDGEKQGLYSNETFRLVLPPEYDVVEPVRNGTGFVAWKYKADKHQGIDSTLLLDAAGRLITGLKGGYNPQLVEDYWYARGEHQSPVLSASGKTIIPDGYVVVELIRKRFFIVRKDGLTGIINDTGRMTVPMILNKIEEDDDSRSGFLIGETPGKPEPKYCLISPAGFLLTKPIYDEIRPVAAGILFKRGNVYGYLDAKGKETIRKWPADEQDD